MLNALELPTLERDGERFVRPQFDGRGLANVAPTVLRLLGVQPPRGLPSLDRTVLPERLSEGVQNVVLLIADGLGHHQLQREIEAGNAPHLSELLARAARGDADVSYQAITSVFPTTTVAALGSVNSGVTPAEHGLLAYTIYVPEFDMVGEMIRWGPLNRRVSFADPEFGHSAEDFFWAPTVYQQLRAAGVERVFAVNPAGFAGTALTRMLHQGATNCGYVATSSLSAVVPRLLGPEADSPTYVYAYWPTIDTIAHLVGPRTEEHAAEVMAFDSALGRLLARLPRSGETLVMLTADHGHIETGPDHQLSLDQHPELLAMLRVPPAGERRAVYLYPRDGGAGDVLAYASERLRDASVAITRQEAVMLGLFGPGAVSERAEARIGEVLLFPRANLQLTTDVVGPDGARMSGPAFRGLHGGLSEDETVVPLLALRV
ncbi:MAG: alkaline phosphatase family protein [Chloroflexota bacterium]|nr:alkaline phosphatase family protein [Chloroflexota bacterium]